ncbi:hypothetical protein GOP47_0020321 [Adiantum capillus-veneris]|uniref:EF-hand domain-containing protein n=1 Tax=Adiantum capillus-veneris TaxID=13818 RepID=A0A9D4UEB0_ADICA|nr:hypothetical protein GOP47_0020321 [Adiantum capillus-veneris]
MDSLVNHGEAARESRSVTMCSGSLMGERAEEEEGGWYFWDLLPAMVERLGEEGLMQELAMGFEQLADARSGTITLDSLRREGRRLGLHMSDAQLQAMLRFGGGDSSRTDYEGSHHLDLHQFCVAILRSSPALLHLALHCLLLDCLSL